MQGNILVDIGNTNTKWKFEENYFVLPTENFDFCKLPSCSKIWVSNVSSKSYNTKKSNVGFVLSQKRYKSLINSYTDSESLGCDRWLGMIACYETSYGKSFILLDIGTAITIDIVNKSGNHLGGLIFPGLKKIRECFDNFSISSSKNIEKIGQSTEEAWTIGTLNIIVNAINHKIGELKVKFPDALIFLTGGGYAEIQEFLEFDHSYHENLVLDGLELYVNNMG